jgi:hypothetical protein
MLSSITSPSGARAFARAGGHSGHRPPPGSGSTSISSYFNVDKSDLFPFSFAFSDKKIENRKKKKKGAEKSDRLGAPAGGDFEGKRKGVGECCGVLVISAAT